jgi:large subunit ribosomal protein L33
MAKNANSVKVRMESSAGTGFRYYKKKNPKNMTEKMKMRKYDPWAVNEKTGKKGAHVIFEEKKMPPSKKN